MYSKVHFFARSIGTPTGFFLGIKVLYDAFINSSQFPMIVFWEASRFKYLKVWKMPVLSKFDLSLAKIFGLCSRYEKHLMDFYPEVKSLRARLLMKELFQCDQEMFERCITFWLEVMRQQYVLNGNAADTIVGVIRDHVFVAYHNAGRIEVSTILPINSIDGVPRNWREAFYFQNISLQRSLIRVALNYVLMVSAVQHYNLKLINDDENNYNVELEFQHDIFVPGVSALEMVLNLCQLVVLNHQFALIANAKHVHERYDECYMSD